jgi:alkylation response protein AidB-like acyl-CoA dehydrogenase
MGYRELDLSLSEFQLNLKEELHKFAIEVLRPAAVALDKLPPEDVVKKGSLYWQTMVKMYENGYHTIYISDEYGGMGLDALGIHIFWEEIAYGSVGFVVSLGVSCFCAFYAEMLCIEKLTEKFIIPFVNCKDASVMSCWGITEPEHGSDILMPGTTFFRDKNITQQLKAVKKGPDWVLNGQKSAWISNGPTASNAALFVNLEPSLGMAGGGICLLDLNQPGVSRGKPLDKMGQRELPQGEIFFDNVVCPGDQMIIDQQSYEAMTELTLAHANMGMGAYFSGLAQACYDLALQYSTERIQGGRRLCEHAWVQTKLFDMFTTVEACRALSRNVMVYNMSNTPASLQHSIASKVFCTNGAYKVASDAVQIFGGLGLSKELPIEKLFRDARAGLIEDGSNDSLSIAAGNIIVKEVYQP